MVAGLSFYQIGWYFIVYSFIGWCVEVIYHAVSQGRILNRGFLNGPVCPIYGFGMLAVLASGNALASGGDVTTMNAGVIFLGGMVLATTVELIGGWALDTFFHARWWDYSQVPFNFRGYICLKFSIYWGLGAIIVVRVVHPMIAASPAWLIPGRIGWPVLALLCAVYLADFLVTVATVRGLNKRLARLDDLSRQMRLLSDAMSESLGESSLKTAQAIGEGRVQASLARMELRDQAEEKADAARAVYSQKKADAARSLEEALAKRKETYASYKAQYEELRAQILQHSHFGSGRFIKAFPDLRHRDYAETVEELKELFRKSA